MSIFKAYDIRGTYPDQLDEALAEKIGLAAGRLFEGRSVVVGRDMRVSSPAIAAALIRGLTRAGKNVVDIGMVTTPMVAFAVATCDYDGGVMVTASHNPKQYIGFKLTARGPEPIAYESGIARIEQWVATGDLPEAGRPGEVSTRDILPQYLHHLLGAAQGVGRLKVAVDAGNGMAGYLVPPLFERIPDVEIVPLYFEVDGTFPNHEANPLKAENLVDLQKKVVEAQADLGVAFDGDADRVAFVDEQGRAIPCDIITALIARETLKANPGAAILYDLRSSWAVAEEIKAAGGVPMMTRVGHSYIKRTMRECDAAFGGELSGHYYFRDNFYCDSGAFALLKVLSLVSRERRPLSELVRPIQRYFGSGEINSEVADKEAKIEELARAYAAGKQARLDGLSVEFDDWWFNVRPSNTEPVLRLVVEAKTRDEMERRRDALVAQIRRPFLIRKVLFTTDFSAYANHALPYALGMAQDHGAELHVLHVVPTPEVVAQFDVAGPVFDASLLAELEQGAREQLEKVVPAGARGAVSVTLAVRRGAAFVEIVRYAREEGIDLIVLATHGRTGLRHALFGSVAEKVVRKAPCPVLSVRPRGHDFAMP
ncbi:MAG TPA: universal stress protein [Planctomycetota bacterium]|nr:universal stress protein [Planctomycetota bacterium]HRR78762.1 universal stress protein [Planctomycetota bacterium]HRT97372.1 universal stress protein [Planctomycetota bacterium]